MEKFNSSKELVVHYFATRFGVWRFGIFAFLLVLLGMKPGQDLYTFGMHYLFVIISLFVFRLVDDVASFHIDRKEFPSRRYIHEENFKQFVLISLVILVVYLLGLFVFSVNLGLVMALFLLASILLYLPFYRSRAVMLVIPLLKYPVIIWCLSGYDLSPEVISLSAGAFFMMLTMDLVAQTLYKSWKVLIRTLLLLITGVLVMQPWLESISMASDLILIAVPMLILNFPRLNRKNELIVVIIPILHLVDLLI